MLIKTKTKIFMARFLQRLIGSLRRGRDPVVVVTRRGIRYRLDLREGIDLAIYLGVYERSTVRAYRRIIRQGNHVIDVGANIGAHTLQFAFLAGTAGKVYAFEPTDYAFAKLKENVSLNPEISPRIVLNQTMLVDSDASNTPGSIPEIYSSWPLTGSSDVHPTHLGKKMGTVGANSMTLDSYVRGAGIRRIDVIKIDVDGYELSVLKGATAAIRENRPSIIMELCPYLLDEMGYGVEGIIEVYNSLDYQLTDIETGNVLPADPHSIRNLIPAGASMNVIANKR